jgi:membrane protease YdiL (CAAX protease family)
MMKKKYSYWGWPLFMSFIRLPLILLGNVAIVLAFRAAGQSVGLAAGAAFSTLSVTIVNVVCLVLLRWRARVEGFRLRDMIGFQRGRVLRDLGAGMLWAMGLFVLLLVGVLVVVFAAQRLTGSSFEAIYLGDVDFSFEIGQLFAVFYALIAAVVFPMINAPVEELVYRGYGQRGITAVSGSTRLGIIIPAIGFGLQHIAFAYTAASTLAFAVGFLLWGVGAGIIARRQQRLAPIIVAHFISNLSFGIVPLFFMLGGA